MNTSWKPVLEYLGWRMVDIKIPMFAMESKGQTYFMSIPDTIGGVIPIDFKLTKKEQQDVHDYVQQWADHIIIGDKNGKWKVDGYRDLETDYQVIPSKPKIEKEARNQIGQAKRYGVTVREMKPEDDYWSCIKESSARQKRAGINEDTSKIMRDYFKGLVAVYGDKVIAGCLYGDDMHYVHSASLDDYQKFRPNHAIMARLIEIADGREIFLGNAPKNLEGLMKYKESFGAELRSFNIKIHDRS